MTSSKGKTMKKALLLIIVLMMIGLTSVSAQDMAKLEALSTEMEQIESRAASRGGTFTAQELQRMQDISIEMLMMTNPGMTRTQAQAMMSQMMMMDYEEPQISADQQRQIDDQNRLLDSYQTFDPMALFQQQQQQPQEPELPGSMKGWPSTDEMNSLMSPIPALSQLRQPAGTISSYDSGRGCTIYLQGGSGVLAEMKRQMRSIAKDVSMNDYGDGEPYENYHLQNMKEGDWYNGNGVQATVRQIDDNTVEVHIYQPAG
jgi:hypothetical protein